MDLETLVIEHAVSASIDENAYACLGIHDL